MSLHKSLKGSSALTRHRNVLSRTERLEKLESEKRWSDEESIFGIPKVRSMKLRSKKKKKKEEEAAPAVAEGEAVPETPAAPEAGTDRKE